MSICRPTSWLAKSSIFNDKSAQERRKHCALAVVRQSQKFSPRHRPLPGVQDGQNLISWRWSLPYLRTQFGEDQCTQFRVIVVTDPQTNTATNPQTDRTDYNALRRWLVRSVTSVGRCLESFMTYLSYLSLYYPYIVHFVSFLLLLVLYAAGCK